MKNSANVKWWLYSVLRCFYHSTCSDASVLCKNELKECSAKWQRLLTYTPTASDLAGFSNTLATQDVESAAGPTETTGGKDDTTSQSGLIPKEGYQLTANTGSIELTIYRTLPPAEPRHSLHSPRRPRLQLNPSAFKVIYHVSPVPCSTTRCSSQETVSKEARTSLAPVRHGALTLGPAVLTNKGHTYGILDLPRVPV